MYKYNIYRSIPNIVLNIIGVIGFIGVSINIFYYFLPLFVFSVILLFFFIFVTTVNLTIEPMDYKEMLDYVEGVMENSKEKIINQKNSHWLNSLFLDLEKAKQNDVIDEVVNKLTNDIASMSTDLRFKTAKMFNKITPTIQSLSHAKTYMDVQKSFLAAEDSENDRKTYFEIADLLEKGLQWFFEKNIYSKPQEIINMFQKHYANKEDTQKAKWAYITLKKITNKKLVENLIEGLRSKDLVKQKLAYEFIILMGGTGTGVIFNKKIMKELSSDETDIAKGLKNKVKNEENENKN